MLDDFIHDLRYAGRALRRNPASTLVALLSLTLGIGATTAIFSVIYGVLISPYPYARPGEIWAPQVQAVTGRGGHGWTQEEVRRLAELPVFEDVMATSMKPALLTGEFAPESFNGVLLTPNAFKFLGVPPELGRTIQPTDVRNGVADPVVVISHLLWVRLFDGRPDALGRTLRLNGVPHTVIGVMPPRFGWYGNDGFWLPMSDRETDTYFMAPIMRLSAGVAPGAARDAFDAFVRQLASETPATFPERGFTTNLANYLDVTVASGEMQTSLRLLLGAVGFLLLIACANVAVLQLARGSVRAREMAVRLSIGADRRRLLRQLLTESVVLSLIGGAAGVAFAYGATRVVVGLMPEFYVPNESRVEINLPVLLFSLGIALVTGIVSGVAPALQTSRADVTDALKAGRSTGAGAQGGRLRHALVMAEVALAVVLLVSAGLTVRTFAALQNTSPGFDAARIVILGLPLAAERYDTPAARVRFEQALLERVSQLPGVEAASYGVPFGGPQSTYTIPGVAPDQQRRLTTNLVSVGYLKTYGIALRGGRMFEPGEVASAAPVAIVNETAAKLWPAGGSPIGSQLRLGVLESRAPEAGGPAPSADVTVIGIVADTRNTGFREPPAPAVLLPYTTMAPQRSNLGLRSSGPPLALVDPVRAALRELDPEQPMGRPVTIDEVLGQEVQQPRFTMTLFLVFAAIGLTLAAAGIYSVLSFHVTRHTHELGLRLAFGATRRHVVGLMLAMGGRLVLAGFVAGTVLSLLATRVLRSQLFGVEPSDPLSYAVVTLVLGAVTLLACWIPARRAAAVDPMVALRQE
jgi:putative ABC transport system permease protein